MQKTDIYITISICSVWNATNCFNSKFIVKNNLLIAEKMKKAGNFLVMIHGFINKEGQFDVSYDYAVDPVIESYHVVGESKLPSIGEIFDTAATWPELELYELSEDDNFAKLAVDSVKERFDYIFIDCPPSLGMLTVKALSVSDGIVIPMQCEFYSLEGMSQLLNTVKTIRRLYNPELRVVGILLTMYNGRLTLTGQVVAELKKYYAEQLFKVPISRSVRLSEAPGYGEPICYHDPYGKGSLEYAAVAKELMMRI